MPFGTDNLPFRSCHNCGTKYRPRRQAFPGEHAFCSDNCRKEFHKHGGAFTKLRPEIIKEVRKQVKERDPLDAEWQRKIEQRITELESFMKQTIEAFSFRRTA